MEVGAVSSLVTTSNSSNSNNSNQSSNNNNNGNSQLIDEANLQSHQQRAQYIISTKGISNCLGDNSIVSATDTNVVADGTHLIEPVCATIITDCPTVEAATAAELSKSSNLHTSRNEEEEEREDNLALIVDIVSKIISEVVQHMPSGSDNTVSPTKPAIKDYHQVQSNLPQVSLHIPDPNQSTDSQTSKPQDLSPDEASSDLVIDADITSNDLEDDSLENEQSHFGKVEGENQEQIEQPPATETITTSPPTLICTQQNPTPPECETPSQVCELPLSSVNNQAKKLDEGKVEETSKAIDPDVNINLINEDNQLTIVNDDDQEDKTKDIVTLRNLEITPPPPLEDVNPNKESDELKTSSKVQSGKRKRSSVSETTSESGPVVEGGRSKRQRTQTRLFQAGDIKNEAQIAPKSTGPRKSRSSTASIPRSRKSTASSTSDKSMSIQNSIVQQPNESHDVIFYEKDDYLAVRSEENTFYLCQLIENVKVGRPLMRIRWLDTNDDGETYFLTKHQDKVFQKSILMPVIPNIIKSEKKGKQIFSLDDQVKANIMDRLNKSLSAQAETVISEQAH